MGNQKLLNTVEGQGIGSLRVVHQPKAIQSVAEGKGLEEGIVNHTAHFTLTTRDAEGRQCFNADDHIKDEQGRECVTEVQIDENRDGHYQISYSPGEVGRFKVRVKVNGEHVQNSPFTIIVKGFQFKAVLTFEKRRFFCRNV